MAAPVDTDAFARDEISLCKENRRACDLLGTTPSCERRRCEDLRVFGGSQIGRRQDRPWRDRVDEDRWSEFERQALGEGDNSCLRNVVRNITTIVRPPAPRQPVGETDNSSAAAAA